MTNRLGIASVLVLVTLAGAGCSTRSALEEGGPLAVGQAAPLFTLTDLQGQQVSLSDFRGKVVLLDFWATWCGPCRMTMPVLEKIQEDFPSDLVLLAVNLQESKELVRSYVAARRLKSRVLLDGEGAVGRAYQSESIPMQVLIDKEGVVRDVRIGYNPQMGVALRKAIDRLR